MTNAEIFVKPDVATYVKAVEMLTIDCQKNCWDKNDLVDWNASLTDANVSSDVNVNSNANANANVDLTDANANVDSFDDWICWIDDDLTFCTDWGVWTCCIDWNVWICCIDCIEISEMIEKNNIDLVICCEDVVESVNCEIWKNENRWNADWFWCVFTEKGSEANADKNVKNITENVVENANDLKNFNQYCDETRSLKRR